MLPTVVEKLSVDWAQFKAFVDARMLSIQWVDLGERYWLQAFDGPFGLQTFLHKTAESDASYVADFETNYKAAGNKSFTDIDGTVVIRPKAAKKGWTYALLDIEFTTSKVGSLYSKMKDGTDRPGMTLKLYDANNVEITDQSGEVNCVRSVVSFEPPYDYEIIGGQLQQNEKPVSDIRVWVIAVPDVPAIYGGSKEMIGGANLRFVDPADKIEADGRVSKLMSYNPVYHSNKLEFTLKHAAGVQHDIMILVELFRA